MLLDDTGSARIMFVIANVQIQFNPDSLVELALGMLSTAYHARGQEALAKYAREHSIPIQELLA